MAADKRQNQRPSSSQTKKDPIVTHKRPKRAAACSDFKEKSVRVSDKGSVILRDDVPGVFDNSDAIRAAVPNYEDSYIKVPKVNHFLQQSSLVNVYNEIE